MHVNQKRSIFENINKKRKSGRLDPYEDPLDTVILY